MEDGQTGVFARSFEDLAVEAERLAPGDGAALARMFEEFNSHAGDVFSLFNMDLSSSQASEILNKLLHDKGRPGYSAFAASVLSTARNVVSSFQSSALRSMLASWVTHLGRTPDEIGSGIWVPLTAMALMGGGMPIPEGGSEKLAQALSQLIQDQGGTILTQRKAQRIVVKNGRAVSVRTSEGEEFQAKQSIVASTSPNHLYLSLLADAEVSPRLFSQAKQFRYGRGCVQIHLALSEPPRWPDSRFTKVGQPHLTDGLDGFTQAIVQGMSDLLPAKPTFTVDCLQILIRLARLQVRQ
ncbi:phytoene desaturase family protein [Paenibacillus cremeus]|uniref:phytoene desaturase family protein n=1 Tax=Paenibacillus cremeus TaxID=2163881 RepID=UPI001C954D42|nr:NAD(P)/FAD-dependent oxidoreductase [Paenibacillus cremeus]